MRLKKGERMGRPKWLKKAMIGGVCVLVGLCVLFYFWHRSAVFSGYIEEAREAAQKRDWGAAIAAVQKALQIYPDDPKAKELLAEFRREQRFDGLLEAGRRAINAGDWAEAFKAAKDALKIHPDSAEAKGIYEEAKRHLGFEAFVKEADRLMREGRLRKALKAYQKALECLKDADVERKVGQLKSRLAEYDAVIAKVRKLKHFAELLPEIEAGYERAKLLWEQGPEVAELERLIKRLKEEARKGEVLVGVVPFATEGVKISGNEAARTVLATLPHPLRGLGPAKMADILRRHSIPPERVEDIRKTTILRFEYGIRFLLGGSVVRSPNGIVVEGWLNDIREGRVHQRHRVEVSDEGDIAAALRLLSALLFLSDEQKKAYLRWFEAARKGRWDEAVKLLDEARKRWFDAPSFTRAVDDLCAMMWRRVEMAKSGGKWGDAARLCALILRLKKGHKQARALLETADEKVVEQVELAIDSGRYEEARRLCEAAKMINPNTAATGVVKAAYKRLVRRAREALEDARYSSVRLFTRYALQLVPGGKEAKKVAAELDALAAGRVEAVCKALEGCDWSAAQKAVAAACVYLPDEKLLKRAAELAKSPHKFFSQLAKKGVHTASAEAVAFSPDGATLATGGRDNTVKLFSAPNLKEQNRRTLGAAVFSLAFSADGELLAAGCADGAVVLLDVKNGLKPLKTLKNHTDVVHAVVFDPKGRYLASASADNTICIWEKKAGWELMKVLREHNDEVRGLAWSRNGKIVASASSDGMVRLWSVDDDFMVLQAMSGRKSWINAVAFSPDSSVVVGGGRDFDLFVWSVKDGEMVKTLKGHKNAVTALAFSPRGRFLASSGWDRTLRLWDVKADFKEVWKEDAHEQAVTALAFSPKGRFLATVARDGTLALWGPRKSALEGLIEDLRKLVAQLRHQ